MQRYALATIRIRREKGEDAPAAGDDMLQQAFLREIGKFRPCTDVAAEASRMARGKGDDGNEPYRLAVGDVDVARIDRHGTVTTGTAAARSNVVAHDPKAAAAQRELRRTFAPVPIQVPGHGGITAEVRRQDAVLLGHGSPAFMVAGRSTRLRAECDFTDPAAPTVAFMEIGATSRPSKAKEAAKAAAALAWGASPEGRRAILRAEIAAFENSVGEWRQQAGAALLHWRILDGFLAVNFT